MAKSKKEEALDVLYPPQEHDGALTPKLIQEAIEAIKDSIDPNLEAFKTEEAPKFDTSKSVQLVDSTLIPTGEARYITAEEFVAGVEQDLGESFDKPISEPSTESAIGMKSSKITTPEEIEENNFLTLLITVQKELNQERLDVEKTNHRGSRIGGTFHRFEQELSFFVTFLQRERLYGQN